jgi:hypothetical protein
MEPPGGSVPRLIVVGWISGKRSFASRLIPGLILVSAAAWAGAILTS